MRNVWIGTSGWTYQGWRGSFYPAEMPAKNWLRFYAEQFPTTEINGSFYRTPSLEAVKAWRDQTPENFLFAWKASKFITHWKRLSDKCRNSLELLETRLTVLEPKVGPILFQLPPQFKANRERLASFLKLLDEEAPLRFRIPRSELVRAGHPRPSARPRNRVMPFRPSRCALAVGSDGPARLRPRPRTDRPI